MYIFMCVCMYACMYACMYVCMHVCMYVCMYVCTYVYMYVCTYVRMYVCTYVYIYICIHPGRYVYTVGSRKSEPVRSPSGKSAVLLLDLGVEFRGTPLKPTLKTEVLNMHSCFEPAGCQDLGRQSRWEQAAAKVQVFFLHVRKTQRI